MTTDQKSKAGWCKQFSTFYHASLYNVFERLAKKDCLLNSI